MIPASLILENSLNVYFFRSDEDQKIVYKNSLFESYCDHIQPKSISDFIKIEGDYEKALLACEKSKRITPFPVSLQCRLPQSTGALRWSTWEVCYDEGTFHWMGVQLFDVVSITSHQYEEQKRLLDKIAWIQSHKVRRPLANIMGIVSLMNKSKGDISDDLINMLSKATEELDEILQSIVNIASIHRDI
jgi:hypothetical protein